MSSHEISDDDEDFGPVLPATVVVAATDDAPTREAAPATAISTAPRQLSSSPSEAFVSSTQMRKRERSGDDNIGSLSTAASPPDANATASAVRDDTATTLPNAAAEEKETVEEMSETAWARYAAQLLPSAPLYERSYRHTSLQATHDVVAAAASSSTSLVEASSSVAAHTVHDICVYADALGALITTVDEMGVVRLWRKLPRGVLFITELDKVFPRSRGTGDGHDAASSAALSSPPSDAASLHHRRCHYWAHAYTALQLLIFVCVEEEKAEGEEDNNVTCTGNPNATPVLRQVRVLVRQVNPVTFTVEKRDAFSFLVPVQDVASVATSVDDAVVPDVCRSGNGDKTLTWTSGTALAYTRRPAFLVHQYTPHLAFFVSLPLPSSTVTAEGRGSGGSGVVLCPCFQSSASSSADSASTVRRELRCFAPVRLSVAHPVVACVQQVVGLEQTGTAACVLVDAAGIVDYCVIDAAAETKEVLGSGGGLAFSAVSSKLTMNLMAGLAAVPPTSREGRLWRRWIRFERRLSTGLFAVLRDAQQALKAYQQESVTQAASGGTAVDDAADVQVIPAAVQLSPDGRYAMLISYRLMRTRAATPAGPLPLTSRIPSTKRVCMMAVDACLHVLDFTSGARVGAHVSHVGTCTTVEDIAFRLAEWVNYIRLRSRALSVGVHVEPSAAVKGQWYVMVPAVPLEQLLGASEDGSGGAMRGAYRGNALGSDRSTPAVAAPVMGRAVNIYEVTQIASQTTPAVAVRLLPHMPGEWETLLEHASTDAPLSASHRAGPSPKGPVKPPMTRSFRLYLRSPHVERERTIGKSNGPQRRLQLCRAPLVLVRRAVAVTQDLKNVVAASPLGAALSPEARKHLLMFPTHVGGAAFDTLDGNGAAMVEALLLVTSAEAACAALLVLSKEIPRGGAGMASLLNAIPSIKAGEKRTVQDGSAASRQSVPELRSWTEALQELHRARDDDCGTLLMAAIAPTAAKDALAVANSGVTAAASSEKVQTGDEGTADGITPRGTADEHIDVRPRMTAPPPTCTTAPRTPVEGAVLSLLKEVLPSTGAPATPPVALVHVRSYGTVRVHLLPSIAVLATENFILLARRHYYDRLTFHRVLPGAIVQGGCPRGDGTGGASAFADGAPFRDEGLTLFPFFSHTSSPQCSWLCMANAGPDTNGSQFFFTVPGGEMMPWLNGHHTVFGYVVEGLDVVRAMSMAARDGEDKPLSPIIMERVDILLPPTTGGSSASPPAAATHANGRES